MQACVSDKLLTYLLSYSVKSATDDWMAQSVAVCRRMLIGRLVIGSLPIRTAFLRYGAAARTGGADCELERERSVSQSCDWLGTSLSRCLVFSHRSTSLTTAVTQF